MIEIIKSRLGWLLLAVYFILHGCQYYIEILSIFDILAATFIVLVACVFIRLIINFIVKEQEFRVLLAFIIVFFVLFYSPFIDLIKLRRFFPKFQYQLVFGFVLIGLITCLLNLFRKVHSSINKLSTIILFFLILISSLEIAIKVSILKSDKNNSTSIRFFNDKDSFQIKPSIYLVLLDEYAGNETLKSNFNFSNHDFTGFLQKKGFRIIQEARSNYNYTLLSVPSMFDGTFIRISDSSSVYGDEGSRNGLFKMYNNRSIHLFKKNGYTIKNYSPFSIEDYPNAYDTRFLPGGKFLLLVPSILDELYEQFPEYLLSSVKSDWMSRLYYESKEYQSRELMSKVLSDANDFSNKPLFCYLHLMIPHAPYIYDRFGNINIAYLNKANPSPRDQREAYLEQLIYTNKLVSNFTDSLLNITKGQSIIIIMSDHGYKGISTEVIKDKFNSFNAVYLPESYKSKWYDGVSNINQFPLLFSTITGLPVNLKNDSIIY